MKRDNSIALIIILTLLIISANIISMTQIKKAYDSDRAIYYEYLLKDEYKRVEFSINQTVSAILAKEHTLFENYKTSTNKLFESTIEKIKSGIPIDEISKIVTSLNPEITTLYLNDNILTSHKNGIKITYDLDNLNIHDYLSNYQINFVHEFKETDEIYALCLDNKKIISEIKKDTWHSYKSTNEANENIELWIYDISNEINFENHYDISIDEYGNIILSDSKKIIYADNISSIKESESLFVPIFNADDSNTPKKVIYMYYCKDFDFLIGATTDLQNIKDIITAVEIRDMQVFIIQAIIVVVISTITVITVILAINRIRQEYFTEISKLNQQILNKSNEAEQYYKNFFEEINTDALTGLYTRTYINDYLEKSFADKNYHICYAICDIDKFKDVNDTYGHGIGDLLLKDIGKIMMDSIEAENILARWGGEEFLIALKNKSQEEAYALCERIRLNIFEHNFIYDNISVKVTMSFGISVSQPEDNNFNEAVIRADMALYKSKQTGRNKISIY